MTSIQEDAFERAVAFVGSSKVSTSNNVKLELYAFYKIATVAATPEDIGQSRPGMFDFAGRAKYDTWSRIGKELLSSSSSSSSTADVKAQARERYIDIAKRDLGFTDSDDASSTLPVVPEVDRKGKKRQEDMTAEELLDEEETEDSKGGKGMTSVSTMRAEDEDITSTNTSGNELRNLHDLASSGHLEQIRKLQPTEQQCNAIDSYGFTPLHLATDRGHTQIVQYLLDRGADRSIQDSEGATALDTARILENKELILILED